MSLSASSCAVSLADSYRAVALALPEGSTLTVPRDFLLGLLSDGLTGTTEVGTLPSDPTPPTGTPLITIAEAAARLSVEASWIYRKHATLPFLVRVGSRALRVDSVKLDRWIARSAAR